MLIHLGNILSDDNSWQKLCLFGMQYTNVIALSVPANGTSFKYACRFVVVCVVNFVYLIVVMLSILYLLPTGFDFLGCGAKGGWFW